MGNSNFKQYTEEELDELALRTNIPIDKVKKYYSDYEAVSLISGGEVPKDKFVSFFKTLMPQNEPNSDLFVTQIYRAFDQDDNGTLNFTEFLVGMYLIRNEDERENLKFTFKLFDLNKDEKLELNEIAKFISCLSKAGCSDEQSRLEFAQNMINDLDLNQDGSISENEFIDGVLRNEKYRKIMPR